MNDVAASYADSLDSTPVSTIKLKLLNSIPNNTHSSIMPRKSWLNSAIQLGHLWVVRSALIKSSYEGSIIKCYGSNDTQSRPKSSCCNRFLGKYHHPYQLPYNKHVSYESKRLHRGWYLLHLSSYRPTTKSIPPMKAIRWSTITIF